MDDPKSFELDEKPLSALRLARKIIVLVVGGSVVLFGVALIVLPGPAFIVIPAGLAILATEFVWARRILRRLRDRANQLISRKSTRDARRSGERD
jgi:uncharacterized protein (TIGR02611 family)